MNKIEKMIQEMCPNGVEWKKLGEVCEIKTGSNINKRFIENNKGEYPVINSGIKPLGFVNKYNVENDPIGITSRGAGVGTVTYYEGKYFRGNLNYSVTIKDKNKIITRYLYQILRKMDFEIKKICVFDAIPALNANDLKKLKIPVPPIEIQEEIVKVLDKFEKHSTELQTKLQAELQMRYKQYNYYRDMLLNEKYLEKLSEKLECSINITYTLLEDIIKIKNGKDWKKLGKGTVPVYGSGGQMNEFVNQSAYDKPTVLIPRKGSLNNVFYLDSPFWNVDTVFYTEINEEKVLPKYFYYFMENFNLSKLSNESTRPSITQSSLNKIIIPLAPLSIQKQVVKVLDKFQDYINDTKGLLPKEIEQRKKQYEYYREKLLTF